PPHGRGCARRRAHDGRRALGPAAEGGGGAVACAAAVPGARTGPRLRGTGQRPRDADLSRAQQSVKEPSFEIATPSNLERPSADNSPGSICEASLRYCRVASQSVDKAVAGLRLSALFAAS